MKRIASLFLIIAGCIIFTMSACAPIEQSNNPAISWVPWISKNYDAPPCDQTRAEICKQIGMKQMDQLVGSIKLYMLSSVRSGYMTTDEAIALVNRSEALVLDPGLSTGVITRLLQEDTDIFFMAGLLDAMGFGLNTSINSTYILTNDDKATIMQYADEIELYLEQWRLPEDE